MAERDFPPELLAELRRLEVLAEALGRTPAECLRSINDAMETAAREAEPPPPRRRRTH